MPARPEAWNYDAEFFALRTPLLPLDVLSSLTLDLTAAERAGESDGLDVERDARAVVEARLRVLLARSDVREAIAFASPRFGKLVASWLEEEPSPDTDDIALAAFRYVVRMAARPTPYGLFAGLSHGAIGPQTSLRLGERDSYRRHVSLDMMTARDFVDLALTNTDTARGMLAFTNSTLFQCGDQYRYIEERPDVPGGPSHFHLVGTDATEPLSAVLTSAAGGRTLEDLARELAVRGDASLPEAIDYVTSLRDSQVLVTEMTPPVTGPPPLEHLLHVLREKAPQSAMHGRAEELASALDAAEFPIARHRAFGNASPSASSFNIDLYKPLRDGVLGCSVIEEIRRSLSLLARVNPAWEDPALTRFRKIFVERWGESEVPLPTALDEELGLGFGALRWTEGSPLLEDCASKDIGEKTRTFGRRDTWLLHHLVGALRHGLYEWRIEDEDVEALPKADSTPLPDAFFAFAALGPSAEGSNEPSLYFHWASGPSGAPFLGRFCHGDPTLHERVLQHVRREESLEPDVLFAEVACLPRGRAANVCLRPLLRQYEIPFAARSGAPMGEQLFARDLLVAVRDGRIVLISKRHRREIMPRITSAHLFAQSELPVYRFLGALQYQGVRGWLGWDWGPLGSSPFLPRVRYGSTILSPASWSFTPKEVQALRSEGFARVQKLRCERDLPRWVNLRGDTDDSLLVDLDNPLGVDVLLAASAKRSARDLPVIWYEALPNPGRSPIRDSEGSYANDLIVPFVKRTPAPKRRSATHPVPRETCLRPVGSEWLYTKLYTGAVTADALLEELVEPAARTYVREGAASSWFFLRYGDPEWHLRVRFRGETKALAELSADFQQRAAPFLRNGHVFRLQYDTYMREVDRYGGPEGVSLAEDIFRADSEAVAAIVRQSRQEGANVRWRLALYGAHAILDDFGLSIRDRLGVLADLGSHLARTLGEQLPNKSHMSCKYREERSTLENLVQGRGIDFAAWEPCQRAFDERSVRIARVAEHLRRLEGMRVLSQPVPQLVGSFVHMFLNRLLRVQANAQEYVLYAFLTRLYRSALARSGSKHIPRVRP